MRGKVSRGVENNRRTYNGFKERPSPFKHIYFNHVYRQIALFYSRIITHSQIDISFISFILFYLILVVFSLLFFKLIMKVIEMSLFTFNFYNKTYRNVGDFHFKLEK